MPIYHYYVLPQNNKRFFAYMPLPSELRSESTFLYNGYNLRVSKTVKKSTNGYKAEETNYFYDRQNVILEIDENDTVKTRYIKSINYIASIKAGNKTSYFLFNGHGDVVKQRLRRI